jgi:hypothetical protein
MEVRYLILAHYAEFSQENKLNLIGGDIDQVVGDSYPYVHNMILAATKLVLERGDGESEHPFRAVIVDEGSDEIIADGAKGTIPRIQFPEGENKLGTGFILPFPNVIFPKEGRYVVKFIVNDRVMAKAPFRVAPLAYYQRRAAGYHEAHHRQTSDGSHDSLLDQ